jgi:hypothetical protein
MKNFDYYLELGEATFFHGMTADRLEQFASYRPGKSFRDFAEAVERGRLEGLGVAERECDHIAERIYGVVEIDTKETLDDFRRRLVAGYHK